MNPLLAVPSTHACTVPVTGKHGGELLGRKRFWITGELPRLPRPFQVIEHADHELDIRPILRKIPDAEPGNKFDHVKQTSAFVTVAPVGMLDVSNSVNAHRMQPEEVSPHSMVISLQ